MVLSLCFILFIMSTRRSLCKMCCSGNAKEKPHIWRTLGTVFQSSLAVCDCWGSEKFPHVLWCIWPELMPQDLNIPNGMESHVESCGLNWLLNRNALCKRQSGFRGDESEESEELLSSMSQFLRFCHPFFSAGILQMKTRQKLKRWTDKPTNSTEHSLFLDVILWGKNVVVPTICTYFRKSICSARSTSEFLLSPGHPSLRKPMPRRLLTVDQWRLRWLNKDLSLVVSSIACFNNGYQSDSHIYMAWSHHKQMHEHVFLLETLYPIMIINEELEWGCISFPGLLNTALMKNGTTSWERWKCLCTAQVNWCQFARCVLSGILRNPRRTVADGWLSGSLDLLCVKPTLCRGQHHWVCTGL